MAKERKGADLIIQRVNGTSVKGELIAVKEDSILLLDRYLGVDRTVDVQDIRVIKIMGESSTLKGGLLGLYVGIIGGFLIGYPQGSESGFIISKPMAGAIGAVIGGVLCASIGVGIGIATSADKTIQIEGKSDPEIQKIMEELRRKARIKNVQ
jgi:uncharacterized membrane protein YeaQ/YmgE (transglycosylase-associated protein family)